jgi:hypothetical protein
VPAGSRTPDSAARDSPTSPPPAPPCLLGRILSPGGSADVRLAMVWIFQPVMSFASRVFSGIIIV